VIHKEDLWQHLTRALERGNATPLEEYLITNSGLPGPRMNLALANAFAEAVATIVTTEDPPVEALETLLDGWTALSPEQAPTTDPRVMLPASAVLSYGYVAAARPDWWRDEIGKLHRAADDSRWRVREMVAAALQQMLTADWPRTLGELHQWLTNTPSPLIARAAAAAVAEPSLLTDTTRGAEALAIQEAAINLLQSIPAPNRHRDQANVLRQALGFTISVCTAAAPNAGFALLNHLADSADPDLRWICRENAKKSRLKRWPDQRAVIASLLT
jgi:hypothetical protein